MIAKWRVPPSRALDADVTLWSSPAGGAKGGGDWCDVVTLSDGYVALTVGDVAGHGEPVAGTMATIRDSVLRAIHKVHRPSEILSVANDVAINHCDGVLVTAVVAFLDQQLRTLTFANAGHPPPLLLTSDHHAFLEHPPADVPLGLFSHYRAADYVVTLPVDALLVLYTDGITEHERDPLRGETELAQAARRVYERPGLDAAREIAQRIFRKQPGRDDAAAIVLRTTRREPDSTSSLASVGR
jgi:serine phosphatase RsbU (regulator of sigma subunit)